MSDSGIYRVLDIINALTNIEIAGIEIYRAIEGLCKDNPRLKIAAGVLIAEESRHIDFLTQLKKEFENDTVPIAVGIYDKVSQHVIKFNNEMKKPDVLSVNELLKYALDFEQANIALLIQIRGEAVNYKRLTDVIDVILSEEEKHVRQLNSFVKK